jgi:hypothetical protein
MFRYKCDNAKCNTIFSNAKLVPNPICPVCRTGTLITDGKDKKRKPAKSRELSSIAMQKAVRQAAQRQADSVKQMEDDQAAVKKTLEAEGMELSDDDEFEDSKQETKEAKDDPAWAPPPKYTIDQRLTSGPRRTYRQKFSHNLNLLKTNSGDVLADSPGRGNANGVMGGTAWQRVDPNGTPYKDDPKNSFDWCHLIADSLGGKTEVVNLVAASYGCNTEMSVIERRLKARTELSLEVKAYCSRKDIAEYIEYVVRYGTNAKVFRRWIDGTNKAFTKLDQLDLELLVDKWIADMGLQKMDTT